MSDTRDGHPVVSRGLQAHGARSLLGVMGLSWLISGCGQGTSESSRKTLASEHPSLIGDNGLSSNGLGTNGLGTNGLGTNGLTTLALSNTEFKDWFNSNAPDYSSMVMSYVVACAYPTGRSLTYTSSTGTTYTWNGRLGLTPDWSSGKRSSVREQQLLSACLAAHVNKFGVHMTISIRGLDARGTSIPVDAIEATTFTAPEAAFFGNLFTQDGAFACSDRTNFTPAESSARACGISSQSSGLSVECAPLVHVGNCAPICTWDNRTGRYTSCTYGGTRYEPLTTKLRPADIYRCGDGVCQISESCDTSKNGNGTSYNSCASDCGICP